MEVRPSPALVTPAVKMRLRGPAGFVLAVALALAGPAGAGSETGCRVDGLPTSLAGQWEHRALTGSPAEGADGARGGWHPVEVPAAWSGSRGGSEHEGAVYRTRFLLPRPVADELLGLALPRLHAGQTVLLNGAPLEPQPAPAASSRGGWGRPLLYALPASHLVLDGWNELRVRVPGPVEAGSHHGEPPLVDRFTELTRRREMGSYVVVVFCVFFLMVAANHLFLFLHRRSTRDNLWFALFALTSSLHLASLEPALLPGWLPPAALGRVGLALTALSVCLLQSFVFAFFATGLPRRARVLCAALLLAGGAALLWPRAADLRHVLVGVELLAVAAGLGVAWLLLGCLRRGAPHARAMAVAFGVLAVAALWDLGVGHGVLPPPPVHVAGVMAPLGFLPFYVAMGMILGHRYWLNFRDATTDRLTGLMQRHYFLQRLEVELERARREWATLVVAMVDLDGFKEVNDSFSHAVGDRVLEGVARVLRASLRPFDLVGRFGGDELCLAMVVQDRQVAVELLARVRDAVAGHRLQLGERSVGVTASIGAAMCEVRSRVDLRRLMAEADQAVYRAKGDGGNCVRTTTPCERPRQEGDVG